MKSVKALLLTGSKMAELKIDESVIMFGLPKFLLGQKVRVDGCTGYVIGLQRAKFSWCYLVAEGDPPNDRSSEDWYDEHNLSAV